MSTISTKRMVKKRHAWRRESVFFYWFRRKEWMAAIWMTSRAHQVNTLKTGTCYLLVSVLFYCITTRERGFIYYYIVVRSPYLLFFSSRQLGIFPSSHVRTTCSQHLLIILYLYIPSVSKIKERNYYKSIDIGNVKWLDFIFSFVRKYS